MNIKCNWNRGVQSIKFSKPHDRFTQNEPKDKPTEILMSKDFSCEFHDIWSCLLQTVLSKRFEFDDNKYLTPRSYLFVWLDGHFSAFSSKSDDTQVRLPFHGSRNGGIEWWHEPSLTWWIDASLFKKLHECADAFLKRPLDVFFITVFSATPSVASGVQGVLSLATLIEDRSCCIVELWDFSEICSYEIEMIEFKIRVELPLEHIPHLFDRLRCVLKVTGFERVWCVLESGSEARAEMWRSGR